MPILRYFVSVGPAVLALLVIINAVFAEPPPRFNDAIYDSTSYAPHVAATSIREGRGFADNLTPAARVRQVFGQFSANEAKRLKRYSSAASGAI
ncbi:hypothetical protein IP86_06080 [Rhodopseudomonas sp. AAP120]|uniref:hypothetical protein n=1 Tax=Rhodopseudomonas sp. AAP120 TaxID=1523430 RepID=UPI0006B9EF9D|nr:hypothetical protein [Rhodopseudomonas sp. AAP120]KPG01029.1 hypothetical protein IP86_06080 [Rhodopseudomonas sp. AAP120]